MKSLIKFLLIVSYVGFILWGGLQLNSFQREYENTAMWWIVFGVAFGGPLGYAYLSQLQTRGKSAIATITAMDDDTEGYFPRFEFTVQGRVYNIRSKISSIVTDQLKPGDKIWIRYNPKNPSKAEVDDGGCALTVFLVITCMAIIVIIIGVLHLVFQAESVGEVFSKVWDLFF